MVEQRGKDATATPPAGTGGAKTPRTERGRRTLRALLDAAAAEFGEKGFHDGSISGITSRAGVALGSFYTYFDSKDEVFRALVRDMSAQVRDHVAPHVRTATDGIEAERIGLLSFLEFVRAHKEIYRIIDEAEFVEPVAYREHYETTVKRIAARLSAARGKGEIAHDFSHDDIEIIAWALMGANVFLGLKFAVWSSADPGRVAEVTNRLLRRGLGA